MGQPSVAIPEKIFFKIGEVCDIVDVQAHVLRYWETEFPMLSPQKNRSGQRTYRRRDVEIALRIKELLYEDLYTIAGAKKRLQKEMREASRLKIVKSEPDDKEYIKPVKKPESDEDLDIEDLEIGSIDDETEGKAGVAMNDETREALKSLAAQLLELREMLKNRQTEESEAKEK
ncbi:MAG: MerR family transcriptional regulator [Acidobacteria bacterium]|nr:MAG: MerR family transcriptional regulator [Acidobacteriota bacterium]REK01721.1 MAG: MerR family transcriptional regulator [Acidobacteriota bacterium]REK14677.1 MAG: MerR family transcriptional regulator [Acidobacteriota bacterium]REK45392.1 MAG: MerR family transcriptional regulator [Acidobacteriota bacterium]